MEYFKEEIETTKRMQEELLNNSLNGSTKTYKCQM